MSLGDAFAPVAARYRAQIQEETWGHLAPTRNRTCRGSVVFAVGCFGSDPLNPTVLQSSFGDLPDSPWFFESLSQFLSDGQSCTDNESRFKAGGVYRFKGTFRNYVFRGTFVQVFEAGEQS